MTFSPDSPLCDMVTPGLGYRRGDLRRRDPGIVRAVVMHTTGGGIIRRFDREGERKGDRDPFDTAVRVYTRIMPQSGHYVIGQRAGQISQVVPEDHIAHHVGSGRGGVRYLRTGTDWRPRWQRDRYEWWLEEWPELQSPAELAGGGLWAPYDVPGAPRAWRRGAPNPWTIALEVVPPHDSPTGPWSPDCWQNVASVVSDILCRRSLPVERDRVPTHSDAHPLARTTRRGEPWDTPHTQWNWQQYMSLVASL